MNVGDEVVYTYNQSIFEKRLLKRPRGVITRIRNSSDLGRIVKEVDCTWILPNGDSFNWCVQAKYVKQIK